MVLVYTAIICLLGLVQGSPTPSDITISSDLVTNYGTWGAWDECPEGEFASAFQLKTEANQGLSMNADDTGLNGIRLFCADPSSPNEPDLENPITSTEAQFGDWGTQFYCDGGIITGFELRQEGDLGGVSKNAFGIVLNSNDDTGANNLRVYCSNKPTSFIEGDGTGWGEWGKKKSCLRNQAVCGIKTQVEEYTKTESGISGGDYTALNNVQMKCCDITNPGETCIPKDKWDPVLTCDGSHRLDKHKCTYQVKRGIVKGSGSSNGGSSSTTNEVGVSSSIGAEFKALSANFEVNFSHSQTTGHEWSSESSSTWTSETSHTAEFEVRPGYKSILSQVVGTCGDFTVYTAQFKLEDYDSNGNLANVETVNPK